MGYSTASGRWADTIDVTLFAAGTLTSTTNGTAVELGDRGTFCLTLNVTAASGNTPTLDVSVETSADGTTFRPVASFAQKTGTGTERKSFTGCDRFVRAVATIGAVATPSFTFSVTGEAK